MRDEDRRFSRPRLPATFGVRRGPPPAPPAVAESSWEEGIPANVAEHRGSLADAEANVAYRWAAGAVAGRDVLEIGCGSGEGSTILLEAGARSLLGVDRDRAAVDVATRAHGERARFIVAEPAALPLSPASFDAVICFQPIETATDPEALIDSLRPLLRPDGLLLISLALAPRHDPVDGGPVGEHREPGDWERALCERFAGARLHRRRLCLGAAVTPAGAEELQLEDVRWLGADRPEDRAVLAIAGDGELPELPAPASLVGGRDLRAYRETIAAWELRARRAEADGAAKHWELVASREAQRRLRKRLWEFENSISRRIFRRLRGRPGRVGEGPPIRPPERPPERWD